MIESFAIVMKGKPVSEELAKECVESGKQFNIDIKEFDAVWGDQVSKEYANQQLRPYFKLKSSRDTKGVRGCFLSHFLLWKKSLEENKPLLIFEHDALIIRHIDTEYLLTKFDDVLNLDAFSRVEKNYETWLKKDRGKNVNLWTETLPSKTGFDLFNHTNIKGLHSYIIKPSGAKKLIDKTYKVGVLPADIAVNSAWCNLYRTDTSLCRINPKYWLDDKKKSRNSYTRTEV